jgi:hypothetical protein
MLSMVDYSNDYWSDLMLTEMKLIRVRCDMGDCDITQEITTSMSNDNETILYDNSWTVVHPKGNARYICSSCYTREFFEQNPLEAV